MTRHATAADFTFKTDGKSTKSAVYFPSMDYLDYAREDGVRISERVDQYLTVLWNEDGEMIGFKLKGVRNYFLTKLKPVFGLDDDDFVWVRDLFVAIATEHGNQLFPDKAREEAAKIQYRRAMKIATEDKVLINVPDFELMAA